MVVYWAHAIFERHRFEAPRKTLGSFSEDDYEDTELGHSYEHKSDSNEEHEDEEDKETTQSFEVNDSLSSQTDTQTISTRNNSSTSELNNPKIKTNGQKKK